VKAGAYGQAVTFNWIKYWR